MILLVDMDAFFASVEQAHHPHLRGTAGHRVRRSRPPRRGDRGVVRGAARSACAPACRSPRRSGCARTPSTSRATRASTSRSRSSCSRSSSSVHARRRAVQRGRGVPRPRQARRARRDHGGRDRARARDPARIDREHGLGASIGIGPNKLIAKMASGVKKPRGLTAARRGGVPAALLAARRAGAVGSRPEDGPAPRRLGIVTVGDLGRASTAMLEQAFGVVGTHLREAAWGRDRSPVVPYHEGVDPKSMGHEVTLPEDCARRGVPRGHAAAARRPGGAPAARRRLRRPHRHAQAARLPLPHDHAPARAGRGAWTTTSAIFEVARALWRANWKGEPLRLLGVSASALEQARRGRADRAVRERRAIEGAAGGARPGPRQAGRGLGRAGGLAHAPRELGHVPFGAAKRKAAGALSREAATVDMKKKLKRGDGRARGPGGPGKAP